MSDKAYYRDNDDRDPYDNYDLLRGPDGFQCLLTEPEDRTWGRDGSHVVKELNRLHADLAAERDLVQRLAGVAEIGLTITMAPSQRRKFMEDEFGLVKREGKWERVK